jgi:hypothetical protein
MQKIVLTFGFIAGALMSVMMVVTMVLLKDTVGHGTGGLVLGYATMVLAFLMVFFGVKQYRDTIAGGVMSFGRALKVGTFIMLIGSACYVATWEVLYFNYMPDFMDKYNASSLEKAKANGATQAQLDAQKKQGDEFAQMYKNPLVNSAMTFLEPLPVGVLMALIAAGVLKRKGSGAPV